MKTIYNEKLDKIIRECTIHKKRLEYAYDKIKDLFPLSVDDFKNLDEEKIQIIDQLLFRFSKLQDAMGERLFKNFLLFLEEDIENKPFIDILNRMEKLEILNTEDWRKLRAIRNELSHTYFDDYERMCNSLNNIINLKDNLINILRNIIKLYEQRREHGNNYN